MKTKAIILTFLIAAVWLINGFFCKVLNLVPRHEMIVARILGGHYARELTVVIGIMEIAMGIWIITGIKSRLNTVVQIVVIAAMNIIEFFLAPDLLLWGRFNLLFAVLFIALLYYHHFHLSKKILKNSGHVYFFKKSSISGRGLF